MKVRDDSVLAGEKERKLYRKGKKGVTVICDWRGKKRGAKKQYTMKVAQWEERWFGMREKKQNSQVMDK